MSWFTKFLVSSLGRKVVMALTGLFLMLFLVIHLLGNFQLLKADGGEAFNTYSFFMTHNPLIKIISYTLYASILIHAWQGILLWRQNQAARGEKRYAVNYSRGSEKPSRNMAWLGIVIFVFIVIHMYQFWFQMHFGSLPAVEVPAYDHPVKDLYTPVYTLFQGLGFSIFYVVCMVVIAVHLWHGFWSSFQTLGLNHKKYTPLIKFLGYVYSIGIPAGFALIPVWIYLRTSSPG